MELTPQERSQVWWRGTIKGAVKGALIGIAAGVAAALLLEFALIPLFSELGPVFNAFLTMTPGVSGAAFSTIPLAIFSGVSGLFGAMFTAGDQAVAAYKEQKEHALQDMKLAQVEGREQMVEQVVSRAMAQPHNLQAGLSNTPGTRISAAEAEISRLQNAPSSLSLH
jgi:hypothetical protein